MATFRGAFRKTRFPSTLPGVLNTQFRVFEAMLVITCDFIVQFALKTDALDTIGGSVGRRSKIRGFIFKEKMPVLDRAIKRRRIII